jgi:hypothetical protein
MAAPSQGLVRWLTRHLSDVTEGETVSRFELLHAMEARRAERLDIWRNDADKACDPLELAQEIQDAAQRDAESRTTARAHRYVVHAYRGESDEHEAQHGFLVTAEPRPRQADEPDPPTEKGVIAHYMRHDENVHKLLMGAGETLIGKLAADVEREREARIKAEQFNWSMFEKYQFLLDKEHERRIEEAKELMKARRVDELMGVVTALIPILATKFLGAPAAGQQHQHDEPRRPELVDPKDAAVRYFFSSLSETEISSVVGCLSSGNQVALGELHRAFQEENPMPADVMARHLAIRKFLKGLTEQEMAGIVASLTEQNRTLLFALYAQYRELEEQEQARKPEILRS